MVSYAELNSGSITLNGRRVPTAPFPVSRGPEIALTLKGLDHERAVFIILAGCPRLLPGLILRSMLPQRK